MQKNYKYKYVNMYILKKMKIIYEVYFFKKIFYKINIPSSKLNRSCLFCLYMPVMNLKKISF